MLGNDLIYNSISSVIGGIASQEIVKIITTGNVTDRIYTYDSENQVGIFN
jgi:hypothetical protein